jgi:hypothetical protein
MSINQLVGITSTILAASILMPRGDGQTAARKAAAETLRIVHEDLVKVDEDHCVKCAYAVKGSIYNPNNDGVKNVVIRYYIEKSSMGKTELGWCPASGSPVSATIKYLPPKQTEEFLATGCAEVDAKVPDPLSAEITAAWDTEP